MPEPVGETFVENDDTPEEENIVVVKVTDASTDKSEFRWDVYSPGGELKERVGYRYGAVVKEDGGVVQGDTLLTLNTSQTTKLKTYLFKAGVE